MNHLSIRIEGGLLSPDFLEMIHEANGQKPADFGLKPRDSLVDEVSAIWGDVLTYWHAFQRRKARSNESLTTITREQWLLPLLEALGYSLTYQRSAVEQDGRSYLISHRASSDESGPPIHLVAYDQALGDRPPSGRGTLSPHALVQDYLNRTDDHLWGIVSNGRILRLLRDSTYFTRPAYIEFDLEQMIAGERLDEFFLLYRLAHRSRLPQPDQPPAACLLEQYHQAAIEQGGRIRDGLRQAVAEAILTFGNSFLRHPRNDALRQKLRDGALTPEAYYQQLLYLIYRLLFLMVAEERNLLELAGERGSGDQRSLGAEESAFSSAPPPLRSSAAYYRAYFSISRLRLLADTALSAPERFDDLYLGLRTLFYAFHDETLAAQLGVPPLNGELFSSDNAPDLDAAHLNNRDLLQVVRLLSYFTPPDEKVRRRVNYAALDVEELGSVYESLLDEQPVIAGLPGSRGDGEQGREDASFTPTAHQPLTFAFVSGMARKTTGSYYTPRELVNEVIKSALVPVIEARLAEANLQSPISSRQSPDAPSPQAKALLALRVCDPACGSGHFLLAAARRLGYELAKVRANADEPSPDAVRAATREAITHCIYGVDKNPLAVDLCKVALWIEGHSRGKPLTFLDYRIRCGDSLVGVLDLAVLDEGIPDAAFDPVSGDDKTTARGLKKQNKEEREGQMSLFDQLSGAAVAPNAAEWDAFTLMPEDTPAQINAKRARYQELLGRSAPARTAANLWTAAFFSQFTPENLPNVPTSDALRRYRHGQPVSGQVVGAANALAEEGRFFHWPLEFPQVFASPVIPSGVHGARNPDGLERPGERDSSEDLGMTGVAGGFDVVLGNPPWERIKLQEQEFFATRDPEIATAANKAAREKLIKRLPQKRPDLARAFDQAKHAADAGSKFLRQSGRFPLTARGDINTYPLFAELGRLLLSAHGRAGLIVPSGLITDYTTSFFFRDLIETQTLIAFFGMDNEKMIFPGIDHRNKFGLLIEGGSNTIVSQAEFTFACSRIEDLKKPERRYSLTKEDLFQINPNTGTCPTFRTQVDAELTKKIYRRVPVLINETTGSNPWGVSFMRMFDMSNDSHLFAAESLPEHLPLYEAKMIWHFDHRYSTYEGATQAQLNVGSLPKLDEADHQDPFRQVQPRYWVHQAEVEAKLSEWNRQWFVLYRRISSGVVERTMIYSLIPYNAISESAPYLIFQDSHAVEIACYIANGNSLVHDFTARQKVGGANINFFVVEQLPVLPPAFYVNTAKLKIVPLILELVYTAWDIAPFAADIWQEADEPLRHALRAQWEANRQATGGHSWAGEQGGRGAEGQKSEHSPLLPRSSAPFPPFKWDDNRRAQLRAELDAYYARLYGLSRDELRYILDPADVYGPDFPGETFRVLKEKEIKAHGEYRTQRLVLAAWDAQEAAIARGELVFDTTQQGSGGAGERGSGGAGVYAPGLSAGRSVKEEAATLELKPPAPPPKAQPKEARKPALDAQPALVTDFTPPQGSYTQRLKRVMALSQPKNQVELTELIAALGDENDNIRWLASSALSRLGGLPVVRLLAAYLQTNPGKTAQAEALRVLQVIGEMSEDEGVKKVVEEAVFKLK